MNDRPTPRRRMLRLALLLAALLHFGGGAAGPWVHALAVAAEAPADTRGGDRRDAERPAHDELACVVCQALGAAALPVEANAFEALATPDSPHHPEVPTLRPLRPAPPAQARGPPVA
ncbi:MAG TPA: hypothetical protein VF263_19695 [Longimicrobiaceae bacterium]